MWQTWLLTIVSVLLAPMLLLLWKVNRVLNRMWDVIQEFPPHRHQGKDVFFPKGMKPEDPQHLEEHSAARAACT